jgi:hypothetical protein
MTSKLSVFTLFFLRLHLSLTTKFWHNRFISLCLRGIIFISKKFFFLLILPHLSNVQALTGTRLKQSHQEEMVFNTFPELIYSLILFPTFIYFLTHNSPYILNDV